MSWDSWVSSIVWQLFVYLLSCIPQFHAFEKFPAQLNIVFLDKSTMNIDKFFNPVFNEEYGAIESDSDPEKQAER